MKEQEYEILCGCVDEITFENKETGFTVLELNVDNELVSVVGSIFGAEVGEELKLTGFYQTHPTYGMQFKAQLCERQLPATASAIQKYLGSGVVKGIGPAMAKRIVDKFGSETLEIIEREPGRLTEITGISKAKAAKLAEEFREVFGIRSLMLFLASHGVNAVQSVAVYKLWGAAALDMIKANPFLMCSGDIGVDFSICDSIAKTFSYPNDDKNRITAGFTYILSHNLNNGHTALPRTALITKASQLLALSSDELNDLLDELIEEKVFYSYRTTVELIFLSVYFLAQKNIASRLQLMLLTSQNKLDCPEQIIDELEKQNKISYEGLQRRAIEQAFANDAFILTGGPGTGKTTTLNGVIDVLEQRGDKVVLATPTGRAAKRITEVTGREAKTIHRLLEVEVGFAKTSRLEFVHNESNPIDADTVIVDEMSMVDTLLFDSLLRGMKPTAKLIMVGDFNQLPSVGAGNILRDLIESDTIPTVELNRIFRQAAQSLIVTNAHAVVRGEMPDIDIKDNDFFFMPKKTSLETRDTVVELAVSRLPKAYGFSPIDDIQILCPGRKGDCGSIALNKRLQQALNPKEEGKLEFNSSVYTFRSGDKVMQIKNNYDITWKKEDESGAGVFNGDIGTIKMIDKGSQTLSIDFDGRVAYYSFDMANEQLELAYSVTVHKSQGSEFEAVVIPIFGGYDKLYFRNLLYTAITRAKKLLILVGQRERIEFMVKNERKTLRYTGLKDMLKQAVEG